MRKVIVIMISILTLSTLTGCFGPKHHSSHNFYGDNNLVNDLNLTKAQQVKFNKLKETMIAGFRSQRTNTADQKLLNLLDANKLDQQQAIKLITKKITNANVKVKKLIPQIAEFTDSLSAKQRAKLKENISSNNHNIGNCNHNNSNRSGCNRGHRR